MDKDIVDLPPVRCFTCGKVMLEKYFEEMDEYKDRKLDIRLVFDKLLMILEQVILDRYSKSKKSLGDVFTEIGLDELYDNVALVKRKYINDTVQDVIQQISLYVDEQIAKKVSGSKILSNIGLDEILGESYLKIKDMKYSQEDVMNRLGLKRPCCRATVVFRPQMALPKTMGAVSGYDIDPDKVDEELSKVEEVLEEEDISKKNIDRAKTMREKLQALKSKASAKPKEKRITKYLAV